MTGQITINNPATSPINDWNLGFDFAAAISSIWDAEIVSHAGNHYLVTAASYDSTIPVNGTVSFGFTAEPGGAAAPDNFVLNFQPVSPVATPEPSFTLLVGAVLVGFALISRKLSIGSLARTPIVSPSTVGF